MATLIKYIYLLNNKIGNYPIKEKNVYSLVLIRSGDELINLMDGILL